MKPNAYLKSGGYVTHIDPEARKQYLEKARNSMQKRYNKNKEYKEQQK